jgi:hypothetical protein
MKKKKKKRRRTATQNRKIAVASLLFVDDRIGDNDNGALCVVQAVGG